MSNLSDLLPAGVSAKQITATDSGSGIASKAPVILNSDGTVTAVGETSNGNSAATAQLYSSGISFYVASVIYDPDTQRIVMVYSDAAASYYAYMVVGTSSATGITWGTPVAIETSGMANYISTCYDTTNDRVAVAYNKYNGSNTGGYYAAYSINGATNTPTEIATKVQYSTSIQSFVALAFDPVQNVIVSASTQSLATKIKVFRLGASSITLGNEANIPNSSYSSGTINLLYEKNLQKVIANYKDGNNSSRLTTVVITPSGTGTPAIGTENAWLTDNPSSNNTMTFDETSGKLLFTYRRNGSSPTYRGAAKVGLASGTSVTVDATETFFTSTGQAREQSAGYDATAKKIGLTYYVHSSGSETRFVDATTSASDYSVTFGTDAAAYTAVTASGIVTYNGRLPYDASVGKMVYAFNNSTTGYSYTNMLTLAATTTNVTNFVGVADSAISASAAGSIIVQGGTVTGPTADVTVSQSLSSAFLFGQDAPADPVNSKAAAAGGNNFLIAYEVNDGATKGARVQAATVTTGNLSYGSSAVIGASTAFVYNYSISYDSTNDKFVVFWRNQTDGYIYAAVVTLTGNSVSYGATSAVYSAVNVNRAGSFSSTYDPDTDRVILGVCDDSDNYAYSVVIELGTTTIDTVGTPQKIDSASATAGYGKSIALCYDTTENKVIATYVYVGGGGSYYLRVAAGTVAGGVSNSTTWGSSSVVYSGDADRAAIAYNATDQRVVVAYKQASDSKGYSSVATVSGTTVTANTPSIFFDAASGTLYIFGLAHDAYVNEMAIYARATAGDGFSGSIDTAANTIVWNAKFDVDGNAYNPPQIAFNSNTNQTIISGAAGSKALSKSYIWTVPGTITGQPLTTGTKYYVTSTGTFSSSADTPSVNAGLAISTTSLLLNGDS